MAEEQDFATKVAQASTGVLLEPALSSEQKEAQVRAKAQAAEARETARRIAARKAELARQAKLDRQRHEDVGSSRGRSAETPCCTGTGENSSSCRGPKASP